MITETITYENFNGETDSRVMHFHISEAVLMDHMTMRDRIQRLNDIITGPTRVLTMAEIQEIIHLVKWIMSLAYGEKSIDGSSFKQDDPVGTGPIWHDFQASAAYNAFLLSIFKDPEKALEFIVNVLPKQLQDEATEGVAPDLKKRLAESQKASRPAPGTRIIDDVPQEQPRLAVAPDPSETATDDGVDEEIDYDKLLLGDDDDEPEDPNAGKSPITQGQYDKVKAKVSPKQFEHFMSTRYVVE